jgi:threonylcarbamoyladenosine tRNA methylthiotransferase CDKAL1
MSDLEDCVVGPPASHVVRSRRLAVLPAARPDAGPLPPATRPDASGLGAGAAGARVWVKAFGCSHSVADGETIAGSLLDAGFDLVDRADGASVWVLNSCTVKTPSQHGLGKLVTEGVAKGVAVVVAGCVPQGERGAAELAGASLLGVQLLADAAWVVGEALKGNRVVHLSQRGPLPALDLPRVRRNAHVEIVPLSQGCLGACTYCKTVHARGKLRSYAVAAIAARVQAAVADAAVREVWFSSEDVACYGRDIGETLGSLLDAVLPLLPADGRTRLRLGMGNPPYFLDQLPALTSALRDPRVFAFLHVPVQSGSDAVLAGMNREYRAADFRAVAAAVAAAGATLATDIICGFPGESREDHEATLALLRAVAPRATHVSRFHARPGTPAARMPQLPRPLVASRSRAVTEVVDGHVGAWTHLVGTRETVGVVEVAADGASLVAHTRDYAQVLLSPDECALGDVVTVDIVGAARWCVRGRVVNLAFRGGPGGGARVAPRERAPPPTPPPAPGTPDAGGRRAGVAAAAVPTPALLSPAARAAAAAALAAMAAAAIGVARLGVGGA